MSNKLKYQIPIDDDEDEIEDGDEMVDIDDDYEQDQEDMKDEDDENDENNGLSGNQGEEDIDIDEDESPSKMEGDEHVYDQDDSNNDQDEEEDQVAAEIGNKMLQNHYQIQNQQQLGNFMGQKQPIGGSLNQAALNNGRMRPQSAKTAPANDQFRFQQMQQQQHAQQMPGQMAWQPQMGQAGYSQQALFPGTSGYQAQNLNSMAVAYQQPNMYYPPMPNKNGARRRPGTANRRNQLQFGKKSISGGQSMTGLGQIPVSNKQQSQMDLEISKLRPRIVQQERERLYDDVMKQRMTTNQFRDENTRLKTKIAMLETELHKKDKVIDDLILQQEANLGGKFGSVRPSSLKVESHLVINLKRKVKDLHSELSQRRDENEALKRNIRCTRINENEVELKMYMEECARLRLQLEEVIRSKDTFADPQELKIIEEKFQQRDILIQQLQNQSNELSLALQTKDAENRQLAELIQDMEGKMKRAQQNSKANAKFKKETKGKDQELSKLRKELIDLKHQNQQLNSQVSDLQEQKAQLARQQGAPPRVSSSYQQSQNQNQPPRENQAQAAEIRRLNLQIETINKKASGQENTIAQLQQELQEKNDIIADKQSDLVRFKELSESYMQEVARLEAQLEAADLKPKSKMSQRPKDNVARDSNYANSSIQGTKIKRVDVKQIKEVFQLLKLTLQKHEVAPEELASFVFESYSARSQVSISQLKARLENLNVQNPKSLLLARFLIEPQTTQEAVFDDNLTETQEKIIRQLQQHIGDYVLYDIDGSLIGKSKYVVKEREMQQRVIEKYQRIRGTLIDALQCEDYDEEGTLDITQLREALYSFDDDLESDILDYLLYYVFMRSQSLDRMEYNYIIQILDQVQTKGRATSGSKKGRPESSSPEKLKMRNPDLGKSKSSSDYSAEDNVKEDDESDDESYLKDVKQLKDIQQLQEQDNDSDNYEQDQEFDESPRPKIAQKDEDEEEQEVQEQDQQQEEDEEIDEEEMIDVAEKIFIRIAEELIQKSSTVRNTFNEFLFEAEIDDDVYELLSPIGLLEGIKSLGIDDLEELEVRYLLKVLSKPELDGAILFIELLQIFENFGLYDEENEGTSQKQQTQSIDKDSPLKRISTKLQQSSVKGSHNENEDASRTSSPDQTTDKKKRDKVLDLSKLDQKSVKIMVMLMLFLLEQDMTTQEFFSDVTFKQNVKSKTKQQTLDILTSEDFFRTLQEAGIRKKATEHQNLKEFLRLSPNFPDLIVLKSIKKTLEQMAENEEFMNAIREDVMEQAEMDEMNQEEEESYARELARIQNGDPDSMIDMTGSAGIADASAILKGLSNTEGKKLATVGENSENAMTTHEKQSRLDGRDSQQPHKVLQGQDEDQENYEDEEFEEKAEEDYEF